MLWKFAEEKTSFDFKTIEDILEENQVCQKENDCLSEVIQGKLADLEALFNTTLTNVIQVQYAENSFLVLTILLISLLQALG